MRILKSSIYVLLQLWLLLQNVYCDEENPDNDDVTLPADELRNIHSFFYMATEEDLPSPAAQTKTNDQSAAAAAKLCNCKEWSERNSQEAVFYKRLIAVLLSNLVMQRIDDRLIGMIGIEASSSQFEYLQDFVNGQGSMREVDRILGSVIKQSGSSTYQYMAEISHYLNVLSERLMHYVSLMKERWDVTVISLVVIASFMILRKQRFSRGLVIFLMIDIIFVISFFITWWRLIQEAEIKLMAAQAQFAEMPIACKPHKMGLWDKMIASFSSTNDCEKYYESIMTNPRLQVTPAFALTHFLSTAILQPVSYFGVVISEFIDNATNKLGFIYKLPVTLFLFLSFCICIILLPFFLLGGSFNLGFGPFLKFGVKARANLNETQDRIERIYENTSTKKRLKHSDKAMKQITLEKDDDLAGGDTISGGDTCHLSEKCKNCKCKNANGNEAEDVEREKKEEGDGDC
ncbi:hypothetical protein DMN91_004227 [Ooceraea biroi]|uniref:Chloride channel CLIC-like protein 1 n=1 Tax=Ooceraea biroi TaxID=2015173 RepID=A0A026X1W2_OOCBI|nr:Chloride channel CLIC-like protein [Ooceraea biroi]RLU24018.1 hypothetical protein DMN91_004227 [Ooceraea biroi]